MLKLAAVDDNDVVYDPGSGDGRIPIAAATQFGARAVGIEIDSNLVAESRRSADSAGVRHLVDFRRGDLFQTDLGAATVVTLYLGRTLNERLRPKLFRELRPGSRVVSQNFDMGDWKPDSMLIVRGRQFADTPVHLWVMPANAAGTWDLEIESASADPKRFSLTLSQRHQRLTARARTPRRPLPVTDATLRGSSITFSVARDGTALLFAGRVSGETMEGTVPIHGSPARWEATRVRP